MSFINEIIYDVVISCIGSKFINSIVKFAEYSFIEHRVKLESFTTQETPKSAFLVLNQTYNELYFERLLLEIREGNERVFANIQNKYHGYRKAFIEYLTAHLTDSDVKFLKSPLLLSCKMGYDDVVLYLVGKWNRLLEYSISETETPLAEACKRGYFDIVKILVKSEKYRDTGVIGNPDLPIVRACENGYTDIVKFLLTNGVYRDLYSGFDASCKNGHTEIVLLLKDKEPKLLQRNGLDVLMSACENGHEEVVRILLSHNIDSESISLYYPSMNGHLNIVKLLLKAKAQVHECDINVAEWNDHEDIVKCLRNHLNL
ncbi:unnamed protein product [Mytilus edulis]|uniref:Ankyrin repeat protein n=1 Tax=Mytilus edulis TaxID=6550 RepID=A0A8S3R3L2_MYTED|nr:unnamed protein product [Mytilus edulis]